MGACVAGRELPPVVSDVDRACAHLCEYGVCRLGGAVTDEELDGLRRAVESAVDDDVAADAAYIYSNRGANCRVWSLFNRDDGFLDLAENASALRVISSVLGEHALVSNLTANITGPGGEAMAPHWDQDWAERPWPHALVAHCIWMLDEFTEDNGATLVCPGSHLMDTAPQGDCMVPATGPPGTALFVDGRTWHGTGPNRTAGIRRIGLLAYYCRPYIRQQENMSVSLLPRVQAGMSAQRRKRFGLEFYEYLNMVDGPPREFPRY
jgi:hypothetical protein